jgi:hypothetical protein
MACEYCGRTNSHDGHGGCYSCGAPLKEETYTLRHHDYGSDCDTSTCCYATAFPTISGLGAAAYERWDK